MPKKVKTNIVFTDLDSTLIKTKSGKTFARDLTDWKFIDKTVKFLLDKRSKGYKIVLVTNQGGIGRGFVKKEEFYKKLTDIQDNLGFEFDEIFVAETMDSPYRKPKSSKLESDLKDLGIEINKSASLMIGDAGWKSKGDFSESDRLFAENLGVEFIHVSYL